MDSETPSAFARRLGINRSTVTRAIQAGRLHLVEGLLDIESSLHRWADTKAGTRPDVAARHAAQRQRAKETHPSEEISTGGRAAPRSSVSEGLPEEAGTQPYYVARRIAAQNNLVKLSMALRAYRRYPLESVRREAHALGGTLRDALDRMVDQTAPPLAVLSAPEDRQRLIERQIAAIRRIIRRELPRAMRRLRASQGRTAP